MAASFSGTVFPNSETKQNNTTEQNKNKTRWNRHAAHYKTWKMEGKAVKKTVKTEKSLSLSDSDECLYSEQQQRLSQSTLQGVSPLLYICLRQAEHDRCIWDGEKLKKAKGRREEEL